jgi:acetylglutamate kinase
MRILVKIGGAQLEDAAARQRLCGALANATAEGHQLIVVHGGGNQIRALTKALQLPEAYHDGLRITDAQTADVVLMVLGGLVNRTLVAAMQTAGLSAVGLSGADGGTFTASPLVVPGADLGYVGRITAVDPRLVRTLLANGHVPVIATTAPGSQGSAAPFFNLNADHAAGPLCRAFECDALLFLTDVTAVLGAERQRLAKLTPSDCRHLVSTRVATGGMLPKLEAALLAQRENPRAIVKIAPAAAEDAVLAALGASVGTTFVSDAPIGDTFAEAARG